MHRPPLRRELSLHSSRKLAKFPSSYGGKRFSSTDSQPSISLSPSPLSNNRRLKTYPTMHIHEIHQSEREIHATFRAVITETVTNRRDPWDRRVRIPVCPRCSMVGNMLGSGRYIQRLGDQCFTGLRIFTGRLWSVSRAGLACWPNCSVGV